MSAGGFHEVEVSQETKEFYTCAQQGICQKLNLKSLDSFKIVKAYEQIVNGKFIWLHLVDQEQGEPISACIYVPLDGKLENVQVSIVEKGHTQPRNPNN